MGIKPMAPGSRVQELTTWRCAPICNNNVTKCYKQICAHIGILCTNIMHIGLVKYLMVQLLKRASRGNEIHCSSSSRCNTVISLSHPELSGCITTLTVRNMEVANFSTAMDTVIDQDVLSKHNSIPSDSAMKVKYYL